MLLKDPLENLDFIELFAFSDQILEEYTSQGASQILFDLYL
jgi:hypothetical protein